MSEYAEIIELLEDLAGADEITEATYVNFGGCMRDWRDGLNEAANRLHAMSLSAPAPSQGADGYRDAFYELAEMLGIGARPHSPKTVWESEMRPCLQALLEPRP